MTKMSMGANRMNTVLRGLTAIGVLSTFVWVFWFQSGELGFRLYGKDSLQHVTARTSPAALISGVIGLCILFVVMRHELRIGDFQIAPWWRRYVALLVDFWFVVYVFGSISTLIPLVLEAVRTNSFQWHFERDYSVHSDWVMVALILAAIAAIVAYFVLPFANRRLTLGF